MIRPLAALVALVAITVIGAAQLRPAASLTALALGEVPFRLGSWQGRAMQPFEADVVAVLGVDDYVSRSYATEDKRSASVYVGYYKSQRQGASIHSPLNCLPGAGWEALDSRRVAFAGGAAKKVTIRKGSRRLLVLYWYQTATRVEGDEYRSRLFTILDTVRHGRNDAALVRVIVPIGADADEADALAGAADLATLVEREVRRVLFAGGRHAA